MGWQSLSAIYVGCVSALLVFVLGRWLGPARFGEYSVVLAIASVLTIVMDGGFRNLIQREYTSGTPSLGIDPGSLLPAATGHALLTTAALALVAMLAPYGYGPSLAWALGAMGSMALVQFWGARLRGCGAFAQDARWQVAQRTLTAGGAALAVLLWQTPRAAFVGWCAGAWLALIGSRARGLFAAIALPSIRLAPWWKACAPFVVIDLSTAIYFRIDVAMLDWLTGDPATAGVYSAAYRLLEVTIFLFNPVAVVLFRHLRLARHRRAAFRRLMGLMVGISVLLAVLLWGGTLWLGDRIVALAYGRDFAQAAALLSWLMGSVLFLLPNAVLSQAAIALNLEWGYARAAMLAAAANVVLNGWWIPLYHAQGAAMATVVTECVLLVGLIATMRKWIARE